MSLNLTQPCDLNLTFAGIMNKDELYMQRCLQLAQNGLGTTYPNPLVGSVIVYENKIISEGWHQKAGKPHAEVNAINNAIKKLGEEKFEKIAPKCSIYVNLEPCSHTGKTPPCALLLVRYNFKEVIVGTLDPHDKVAGRGIKILEEAGISCKTGILVDKCNEVNKRFFSFHKYKKPYVLLKWAQTNDAISRRNLRLRSNLFGLQIHTAYKGCINNDPQKTLF
ncbi:bifunctional diaminohydroxyphosphoribosylaminopyrimidine deaminase/5-amino-6-(5-phosphoribosylamino)uracil reductase RibD [Nonlabens tegetincola]|uniref:bifunctional diaminohydroxyphosphoribosylaminopyrimidine deaminase/5-amino-6-(5-phosphoribosylamino)uracil reductase RibD n=1 Tax=Nonlabens tegetincola TaxID=323273 RepID=UPI001EEE4F86|nr:bifunctional diaminohydroxyphosphoribosylaminopyrimidine deaminase/5-amino-6-(5-phosphoribosylamino)uracil reductase RibD [Nonlabens tegetincola]